MHRSDSLRRAPVPRSSFSIAECYLPPSRSTARSRSSMTGWRALLAVAGSTCWTDRACRYGVEVRKCIRPPRVSCRSAARSFVSYAGDSPLRHTHSATLSPQGPQHLPERSVSDSAPARCLPTSTTNGRPPTVATTPKPRWPSSNLSAMMATQRSVSSCPPTNRRWGGSPHSPPRGGTRPRHVGRLRLEQGLDHNISVQVDRRG